MEAKQARLDQIALCFMEGEWLYSSIHPHCNFTPEPQWAAWGRWQHSGSSWSSSPTTHHAKWPSPRQQHEASRSTRVETAAEKTNNPKTMTGEGGKKHGLLCVGGVIKNATCKSWGRKNATWGEWAGGDLCEGWRGGIVARDMWAAYTGNRQHYGLPWIHLTKRLPLNYWAFEQTLANTSFSTICQSRLLEEMVLHP